MITIIDYNAGNLASVSNALRTLNCDFEVTNNTEKIKKAKKIIFPGVGNARAAMRNLEELDLLQIIKKTQVPFLGICLGMQLLLDFSEEMHTNCLGVIEGKVKKFKSRGLKVPHIGWNSISFDIDNPLFKNISLDSYFYFVHSYYADPSKNSISATCKYSLDFASAIQKGNFYGVQFHPEKSGEQGQKILQNFINLDKKTNYKIQNDFLKKNNNKLNVIPAIDLIDGKCVRLKKGDYQKKTIYAEDPLKVAQDFYQKGSKFIHIIDLDGAKKGSLENKKIICEISKKIPLIIQTGGGIRTYDDAHYLLNKGIHRIIVSSMAVNNSLTLKTLINEFGPDRVIVSVDASKNKIKTEGWLQDNDLTVDIFLDSLKEMGVEMIIYTDIDKDGTLKGPNIKKIEDLALKGFKLIVAGGISSNEDIKKLSHIDLAGVITGKAIYEGKIDLNQCFNPSDLAKRIIPCMDIKDNRIVKGTNFKNLIDAGDPIEVAKKYSDSGADELVFLDITACLEKRNLLYDLVQKIAQNINIPFTVGGGVSTIEDIRNLLRSGADKVGIGSAAVNNPDFIKESSEKFGAQCIVISIDPKKNGKKWEIFIKGGRENTGIDAIEFCQKMEEMGAGELLVNSIDRDGMKSGYDNELLAKISEKVNIPIIASSGAGKEEHFLQAFLEGKADAALAASLFHFNELQIDDLKKYLKENNLCIR